MRLRPPTPEQANAIALAVSGQNLNLRAYAGAGKSSTLDMIARAKAPKRGLYLAFNRVIADEAKKRFPTNITVRTFHGQAYASVDRAITAKVSLAREPHGRFGERYGLDTMTLRTFKGEAVVLTRALLAKMIRDGVDRFCRSADAMITGWHIPIPEVMDKEDARSLRELLLPYARRCWDEAISPKSQFGISHDIYLKLWALSQPKLPFDFIMGDEMQDADGVMVSVMQQQTAQLIVVGDSWQQIYEWRGAIDALSKLPGQEARLTQSFRFGDEIADLATQVLALLGEQVPLKGTSSIPSEVIWSQPDEESFPDAILCRTNARAIQLLVEGIKAGKKVALEAKVSDIKEFAEGAQKLKSGARTLVPYSLSLFEKWDDVVDYAKTPAGRDIRAMVNLVATNGPDFLLEALEKVSTKEEADYTISTVHKSKGLEWDRVRLESDFKFKEDELGNVSMRPDELRVLYVALTRAKKYLEVWPMKAELTQILGQLLGGSQLVL